MKILATLLLYFTIIFSVFSQDSLSVNTKKATITKTIVYKKRSFKSNLKQKYNGKKFTYKDEEPPKTRPKKKFTFGFFSFLVYFLSNIFPYIIVGFIIYIFLKIALGKEFDFFGKLKRNSSKKTKKLVYQEITNINEVNFESLIETALQNKDYRLATRYYYLLALQKLTQKEFITYHKDKTNAEYVFELNEKLPQKRFSQVSYIYNYVWYGEFEVNEQKFKEIKHQFKLFLQEI